MYFVLQVNVILFHFLLLFPQVTDTHLLRFYHEWRLFPVCRLYLLMCISLLETLIGRFVGQIALVLTDYLLFHRLLVLNLLSFEWGTLRVCRLYLDLQVCRSNYFCSH